MDVKALAGLFAEGELDGLTMVWHSELPGGWKPLSEVCLGVGGCVVRGGECVCVTCPNIHTYTFTYIMLKVEELRQLMRLLVKSDDEDEAAMAAEGDGAAVAGFGTSRSTHESNP